MTVPPVVSIGSRDNPLFKELKRLAHEGTAYRRLGRLWLEGDHLCRAALVRGWQPSMAVFSEEISDFRQYPWALSATKIVVMAPRLLAEVSTLESPAPLGCVLDWPGQPELDRTAASLVLDRVQDAGNAGSMLRSAAAFGFAQVVAIKGTVALWGPKVLRAGMGAHFGLRLVEGVDAASLADALQVPWLATSSHGGTWLHQARLPWPCAWVLGHEGQGVSEVLAARAAVQVRIAQPGGEESLNVAAAAAICLHASAAAVLAPTPSVG